MESVGNVTQNRKSIKDVEMEWIKSLVADEL